MSGIIVTITGPTCAGKSVLEGMLTKQKDMLRVISHTTRKPRPGESDGVEYFFVNDEQFQRLQRDGQFLEAVSVHGNWYGSAKDRFEAILDSGRHAVIVIDPAGRDEVLQFADKIGVQALPVFVTNPGNVRAKRFIDRVATDFALSLSNGGLDAAIKKSAARLDGMLSDEVDWRAPDHPNAITFGRFDEENQQLVIGRILGRVTSLHNAD